MRFKKVYIEITNKCNLNCSFCHQIPSSNTNMTLDKFEHILTEIKPFTNYIYLHVKGEPLIHPELEAILNLCTKYNFKVNITTNGTLFKSNIDILSKAPCLNQINFSLHSENNLSTYFVDIFDNIPKLLPKVTVIYRIWTLNDNKLDKQSMKIVDKLKQYYKLSTKVVDKIYHDKNIKIASNIYVDKGNEFIWPSLKNNYYEECGYCYGLKSHVAILVNGTVVPCCLDDEGIMFLGNIFDTPFEQIINSDRAFSIIKNFQNRCAVESLCCHCSYKERFDIKVNN